MNDLAPIEEELDRWHGEGRRVRVWWRDDDARQPSAALDRLLDLAENGAVPLAIAAVPAKLDNALARRFDRPGISVLQHGYAHRNHAGEGARAVECGGDRPLAETLSDLCQGSERLRAVFGARFVPVMVPPWNRIAAEVAEQLPDLGFTALSVFGPRASDTTGARLAEINAHLDVLTWKGGARFAGWEKCVSLAVRRLAARRVAGDHEAFGLLTHHLDHDEATWAFVEAFVTRLSAHPAMRWCSIADLLARKDAGPRPAAPR